MLFRHDLHPPILVASVGRCCPLYISVADPVLGSGPAHTVRRGMTRDAFARRRLQKNWPGRVALCDPREQLSSHWAWSHIQPLLSDAAQLLGSGPANTVRRH